MRTLVIETASEACSIALFEGDELIASDHRAMARGHAESLVPMIAALPRKGRAERILVSLGPGSFTGVRIGLATARALAFAWGAEVLGYPTLALIAAQAHAERIGTGVTVATNGGHGEWFVQDFAPDGLPLADAASLTPEAARARPRTGLIAGSRAALLAEGTDAAVFECLPDAAAARLLPQALLTPALTPIYGRGPDATPMKARIPA